MGAAEFGDPRFWALAAAALVAALIRGFSGFGAGLVFMPVAAALIGPREAAGVLFIIDTVLVLPFLRRAAEAVDWREILPLGLGAALAVPAGAAVLLHMDPVPLRWGLSLAILVSVAVLWSGWRYRGPTRLWLSLLVGGTAGFMSGAAQIPGPPVLVYWLGRQVVSATMRANAFIFFCFTTVIAGIAFTLGGIFTAAVATRAAILLPVYALGLFAGGRMFGLASEATYRRITYASIIFAAVASLPVFTGPR